jgi:hypothetical protein
MSLNSECGISLLKIKSAKGVGNHKAIHYELESGFLFVLLLYFSFDFTFCYFGF